MNLRRLPLFALAVVLIGIAGWMAARQLPRRLLQNEGAATVLMTGKFHQVAHKGSGIAVVSQLPNGQRVLQMKEFRTGTGQDLMVYLIAAPDAFENETVEKSEFVPLGLLQSNQGDQSYAVPAELDLNKYRAVTIWNRKYRVNFTTAPLKKAGE